MKDKKAKYPQLRFKGFTDPWEQRKLADVVSISAGGDVDKTKLIEDGGYPVLANALTNSGIVGYYDSYKVEAPAVTVTGRGDVGHAVARHVNFTPVVRLLSLKSEVLDADFLANMLNQTNILVESTGVPQLTAPQLGSYKILYPNLNEQTKIGKLLNAFDNLIALHQRKLTKLKELKQGYLQKMFPKNGAKVPELRFAGFADAWEQRKLTEIVNRVNKSSNSDVLPKVEFEDIVSGEGRLNKDISSKLDSRKGTLFESENILYGKLRPYLKNWLFPDFEGVALGDFWVFEATDVSVPSFDYYLIQSDDYQKVANDTSGTKMPRSDWKNVSSTDFAIPSKDEQRQIGTFFKQLDNTITLHQRKFEKLQELKKGYLQKMFV